jgi:hypothetical protein
MSGWGCPHEVDNKCQRVNNLPCDPGMKGCVLFGRFRFSDDTKNRPKKRAASEHLTHGDDERSKHE